MLRNGLTNLLGALGHSNPKNDGKCACDQYYQFEGNAKKTSLTWRHEKERLLGDRESRRYSCRKTKLVIIMMFLEVLIE